MDRNAALQMYRVARTELVATEAELADLNRHRSGLQKVIEGLEEVYPELARGEDWDAAPEATPEHLEAPPERPAAEPSRSNGYPPRGKGAVIAVLSEQPSRWFTTREVLAAMAEHGWTPTSETPDRALRAVTNAIGRAIDDGKVQRMEIDGRAMKYRHRPPGQPAEVKSDVT